MSRQRLDAMLDRICKRLGTTPQEVRFGRTAQRHGGKLVTAARGLFIMYAWRRGATRQQIAETLELSRVSLWGWLKELQARGLVTMNKQEKEVA